MDAAAEITFYDCASAPPVVAWLPVSLRDWIGDFAHENGNYLSTCFMCGQFFLGHKRRHICHLCADQVLVSNVDVPKLALAIGAGAFV